MNSICRRAASWFGSAWLLDPPDEPLEPDRLDEPLLVDRDEDEVGDVVLPAVLFTVALAPSTETSDRCTRSVLAFFSVTTRTVSSSRLAARSNSATSAFTSLNKYSGAETISELLSASTPIVSFSSSPR